MSVACGGGGGGGGGGESAPSPTATEQPASQTVLTFFRALSASLDFDWVTTQRAAAGVTLSRASGQVLGGELRVQISHFICQHPEVGTLPGPMAMGTIASYALSAAEAVHRQLTISLDQVQLPAATERVLVEVLEGNAVLYSRRHAVSMLAALNLSFPDSTPAFEDGPYLDQCL